MSEAIKVDIWSDVQCPWCYIGKRRFEQALAGFDGEVDVEFHSFQLVPDAPLESQATTLEYLQRKGMSAAQAEASIANVSSAAAEVGLDFDLDDVQKTNTSRAHQLLHFAKLKGKQAEMKERLLRAYFVEGRHVGRVDELEDLAADIGLDRDETRQVLDSGRFVEAVQADLVRAQELDIHSVPFFVFEGRYGIPGAQEPAMFLRALEKLRGEQADAAKTSQ